GGLGGLGVGQRLRACEVSRAGPWTESAGGRALVVSGRNGGRENGGVCAPSDPAITSSTTVSPVAPAAVAPPSPSLSFSRLARRLVTTHEHQMLTSYRSMSRKMTKSIDRASGGASSAAATAAMPRAER